MKNVTRWNSCLQLLPALVLSLLLCSSLAPAIAAEQLKMNMNISGTVVVTGSCTFDVGSGTTVGVDFGRVNYSTLNGFALIGSYRKALNSDMTCTGDTDGTAVMTFSSSSGALDFNGRKAVAVKLGGVSTFNMGIQFLVNGTVQDPDVPFSVDMNNPPSLEAELISTGATKPVDNGAALTASATLTMAFQ